MSSICRRSTPALSRLSISLTAILATTITTALAAAVPETVELTAEDGHRLTGTLWANGDAPGVVLLHQCNADRSMYEELGAKLADAGFKALSIDFRGFADSKGGGYDLSDASREDWDRAMAGFPLDAEAAYAYLAQQGAGKVIGAIGASCGGYQLIPLARDHPELQRLAFFSSFLSPTQERDIFRLLPRQFLFIFATGDARAARPAGTLAYRIGRDMSEQFQYEGDAHGYPLFEQDPDLADKIVDWFALGL
ncbi:MAG: alpha/beta fold hydrolase [Thermoanaerobaculia bacterium]|nr:alpha/beta fold hydrolase [Thermoanaerobaculia bacterium]